MKQIYLYHPPLLVMVEYLIIDTLQLDKILAKYWLEVKRKKREIATELSLSRGTSKETTLNWKEVQGHVPHIATSLTPWDKYHVQQWRRAREAKSF